jgi:hypothetical protein
VDLWFSFALQAADRRGRIRKEKNNMKILGVLDIIVTLLLIGVALNLEIPMGMIIFFTAILFLKALPFLPDIGSVFDVGAGVLLILSLFITLPMVVFLIAAGLLGLKGVMSLFSFS